MEAMMQPIELRTLTADEALALERLAHSRTASARTVERARILWAAHQGDGVGQIAVARGVDPETVRRWVRRFNTHGLVGLEDRPRPGRRPTYSAEQVAEIIAAALTKPDTLGLPFAMWTLDRLVTYLAEQKGIAMKRTRLDEVLHAEGLRWRKHEPWFGERVDPAFAEKRGSSRSSTPARRPVASS
jgi:transposase